MPLIGINLQKLQANYQFYRSLRGVNFEQRTCEATLEREKRNNHAILCGLPHPGELFELGIEIFDDVVEFELRQKS